MENSLEKIIKLLVKSVLMGTANKLPGISGGLVALITGFYEEMIESFKKLDLNFFKILLKRDFNSLIKNYNVVFLLTILLGIIISYFTTSQILDYLFIKSELYVWSVFFGMVVGSIFILLKKNRINNKYDFYFVLIGLLFGMLISNIDPFTENKNLFFIFFCGFISICGMIIPGISGSFLLIILGNYKLLLVDSVNNILYLLKNFFSDEYNYVIDYDLIYVLIIFCIGSIFGLVVLSSLLSYLIRNFNDKINNLIIGFVSGSLLIIWPWRKVSKEIVISEHNLTEYSFMKFMPDLKIFENLVALGLIILGCIFIIYVENYAKRKKNLRINR